MLSTMEKNKGGKEDREYQGMGLYLNRKVRKIFTAKITFKQTVHFYQLWARSFP